ncbi:MAG: magnesium chelatase subunit H [Pseudomonadota bacterium]
MPADASSPIDTQTAERPGATPMRVVVLSMDAHLAEPLAKAEANLRRKIPGLTITLHTAIEWERDPEGAAPAIAAIETADVIVAGMLFLEQQIAPILPALTARAPHCDAFVGALSSPEIVKLTRVGKFRMDKPPKGPLAFLKRLRGSKTKTKNGAQQARLLRRLPKILKFVPGTAQDVRAYFLTLQYWLAGCDANVENMVAALIHRYADGPRAEYRARVAPADPVDYPDVGVYHPRMTPSVGRQADKLPLARSKKPTVGVLILRSYVLSGDADHYDGVIAALEARGLRTIPAFASGLDAREAIDRYFIKKDAPIVDAVVSLTGFSLVGGPAYNDAASAADVLSKLDVPYLSAQALEFQSLAEWGGSERGLSPVEATMMVAMPELDGATNPTVFGGRAPEAGGACAGCDRHCSFDDGSDVRAGRRMRACPERAEALAGRVDALVRLRRKPAADRNLAIVLFNFPPNSGAVGTAAYLSVFESLQRTLNALKAAGYPVDPPASADALRESLLGGNAERFGADANVVAEIPVDDYVRREPRLEAIEAQWGAAPGRQQTNGRTIHVYGVRVGGVLIAVQPAFGYEGDPMRLLFEQGFTPTHAFSAFYRYLREDFDADAVLHFGTHGALEFMPGKQTGLSGACWPDALIADVPNFYFYASNNPSEAAIAKRRSAATTVSYLTPAVTQAGLYAGLSDLKATVERWRATPPADADARARLADVAQAQAAAVDLAEASPAWTAPFDARMETLRVDLAALEETLIPHGLHVAGEAPGAEERADLLAATRIGEAEAGAVLPRAAIDAVVRGDDPAAVAKRYDAKDRLDLLTKIASLNERLLANGEIDALVHAVGGGFVRPAPGGDVIRNPEVLPTGRNIHGFDPYRMPSAYATRDGAAQAARLLERHVADGGALPETVAMVLWGTDNLKTEGAPVAQALALMGARPRTDGYGRISGADLIPLEELGRPRIDVMATLSGIFRDLLPLQTRMLADAALKAAQADEPSEHNFVRKHALAYQAAHGCDMKTAALRVFSNADGAYGANVNQLIDAGCWDDEDQLADAFSKRKCFAYGTDGEPAAQPALLDSILKDVDVAYQNLDSVELGVTTIDHYFDTLGGISRAVKKAKGDEAPVYIGDQTRGDGAVRTLSEQVDIETRTRALNPKWYEAMLRHGYEGVRQIEAQITNTMGWSATTGDVPAWVYQKISETYVLDTELQERLATLNPKSCARLTNRLLEASERNYWQPDEETLAALKRAGEDLEDRIEGVAPTGAVA